jgi:O-6-methylguanine DNA methyltransferase
MNRKPVRPVGATAVHTSFGWVGIAWSSQGLTGTTLPQPSEREALAALPIPTLARAQATENASIDTDALTRKLRQYFDGQNVAFDEPLDPTIGTRFQQRVWAITRAIRRGQTRTYGQIAREAGSPAAARAVGQAMARNPWPIIVPCHRVVGHDGRLTGFGGGLPMKEQMLALEGSSRLPHSIV